MGTRDYLVLGVGLALCSLVSPRVTAAQAWLADRERAEGHGVRVGDVELHPGIGAEVGVETNPFLESDEIASGSGLQISEEAKPSATFRLSPHLFLSTLGKDRLKEADGEYTPPAFAFRGGVAGSLQWFGVGPGLGNDNGLGQTRYLGRVGLDEQILPERPFSIGLEQEASISQLPLQGQQSNYYHMGLGGRVELGTVGGLLRGRVGYKFNLDRYDAAQNDGHDHNVLQGLTWQFLPKTALFQDLEVSFRRFQQNEDVQFLVADKENNTRVTVRGGVNGAITKELTTTLSLGYGVLFFNSVDQDDGLPVVPLERDTVVGQAQLGWRPSDRVTMSLGYGRTLDSALQGNTVLVNNFFLRGNFLVGGVLLVAGRAELSLLDYGADRQQASLAPQLSAGQQSVLDDLGLVSGGRRSDVLLTLDLNGEYRVASWFAITAQLRYDTNFADYAFLFPSTDGDVGFASPIGFTNVTAVAGIRAFL